MNLSVFRPVDGGAVKHHRPIECAEVHTVGPKAPLAHETLLHLRKTNITRLGTR